MANRCLSTLLIWLSLASSARAHGLGVEIIVNKGMVEVSAFFSDDSPAASARIRVTSFLAEDEIATGHADSSGRWSFPVPKPGRYRVEVNAGDGHARRDHFTVPTDPGVFPVHDGATREEFTRFPWGRLAVGLAVIGAMAWAARRFYSSRSNQNA